jgi:hypothetical protein
MTVSAAASWAATSRPIQHETERRPLGVDRGDDRLGDLGRIAPLRSAAGFCAARLGSEDGGPTIFSHGAQDVQDPF